MCYICLTHSLPSDSCEKIEECFTVSDVEGWSPTLWPTVGADAPAHTLVAVMLAASCYTPFTYLLTYLPCLRLVQTLQYSTGVTGVWKTDGRTDGQTDRYVSRARLVTVPSVCREPVKWRTSAVLIGLISHAASGASHACAGLSSIHGWAPWHVGNVRRHVTSSFFRFDDHDVTNERSVEHQS